MRNMVLGVILLTTCLNVWAQRRPDYYEPGMGSGQSNGSYYDIRIWCESRIRTLRLARQDASVLNLQGRYQEAINTLERGLKRAHRDIYSESTPISQQLLSRGVKISATLKSYVGGQRNGFKAVSYFMDKYIQFVEDAMVNVDIPYYRPGDCGYCHLRNNSAFEQALINLARLKLELANDTLIFAQRVVPIGPPALYLKAMEVLTYYSKADIENSLFANYYACQVVDLDQIHYMLRNFNEYGSPRSVKRIIFQTFDQVEEVIRALSYDRRCY